MTIPPRLPIDRRLRAAIALALGALLAGVALVDTSSLHAGFPDLCGFHRITGLPCALCGGTRAAHALLWGNYTECLRMNPVAIPVVLASALAIGTLFLEALFGRALINWPMLWAWIRRAMPLLVICGIIWWGLHIYYAVTRSQGELVNFRNPIAAQARALLTGASSDPIKSQGL